MDAGEALVQVAAVENAVQGLIFDAAMNLPCGSQFPMRSKMP